MSAAVERVLDPLHALLVHEKARLEWNRSPGWDEDEEARYQETYHALEDWDQPATSLEGVAAALRHIVSLIDGLAMPEEVAAMAKAALGYFERKAQPSCSPD